MIPDFDADGNLPPGVHWADWDEVALRFGCTEKRKRLLSGLLTALESLRNAGCLTVYVDGSFASEKDEPADFDACWDISGVDARALEPTLLDFRPGRMAQKAKFGGELFPASWGSGAGPTFLEFFQTDKHTGGRKGNHCD